MGYASDFGVARPVQAATEAVVGVKIMPTPMWQDESYNRVLRLKEPSSLVVPPPR
jgi:hypothetical protein